MDPGEGWAGARGGHPLDPPLPSLNYPFFLSSFVEPLCQRILLQSRRS
ncbi:unnamed protein product [Linum tenue]|uniref:Uncharacterized protein n=1 Tax=Linum tenue TaxID=586396 RepID=A0AAV0J4V3_9ROSI|nr:unnamed protein product [Linum tenue]